MSGTLTVPAIALAAIRRGDEALNRWVKLLECGTVEQIAAELCWRGAMMTADIQVWRALHPIFDPRRVDLVTARIKRESGQNSIYRTSAETRPSGVTARELNAPNQTKG